VTGHDIDALLPPRVYGQGLCIPQTFKATLEFRRTVHELRDRNRLYGYPDGYVEQHHARIRWSRFALIWPAIGAQMIIEREVSP
jgi:hypothetical protein